MLNVLLQDEETFKPKLFVRFKASRQTLLEWPHITTTTTTATTTDSYSQYAKLPDDIANRYVLLLDPMLGTLSPHY